MLYDLRYADDIIISIARTVCEHRDLVPRLEIAGCRFRMVINAEKTKVMATNGVSCDIRINGIRVAQV